MLRRKIRKPQFDIAVATQQELTECMEILQTRMEISLDMDFWNYLAAYYYRQNPALLVAKRDGKIAAIYGSYPSKIRLGGEEVAASFNGQLCTNKASGVSTRGAGVEVAVWAEYYTDSQLGANYMIGFGSPEIMTRYYSNFFGYSREIECSMYEYCYYDMKKLAARLVDLCNSYRITCKKELCVQFIDTIDSGCMVRFSNQGVRFYDNPTEMPAVQITVKGVVWPLLRVLIEGRARRHFSITLRERRLRVKGMLLHPIAFVRMCRVFYTIYRNTTDNG